MWLAVMLIVTVAVSKNTVVVRSIAMTIVVEVTAEMMTGVTGAEMMIVVIDVTDILMVVIVAILSAMMIVVIVAMITVMTMVISAMMVVDVGMKNVTYVDVLLLPILMLLVRYVKFMDTLLVIVGGATKMIMMMTMTVATRVPTSHLWSCYKLV
jgi:hypothetical protein